MSALVRVVQTPFHQIGNALRLCEQDRQIAGHQFQFDFVDGFAFFARDHGAVVQRDVDLRTVRGQAACFALDLDVEHRLQVGGRELAEIVRQRRVDDEAGIGNRVRDDRLPLRADDESDAPAGIFSVCTNEWPSVRVRRLILQSRS